MSPDGGCGSNLEHSAADGVAAVEVDIYVLDMMYVVMAINFVVIVIYWQVQPYLKFDNWIQILAELLCCLFKQ